MLSILICAIWLTLNSNLVLPDCTSCFTGFFSFPHAVIRKAMRKIKWMFFMITILLIFDNGFAYTEIQIVDTVQKLLTKFDQLNVGTYINTLVVNELQQADISFLKVRIGVAV